MSKDEQQFDGNGEEMPHDHEVLNTEEELDTESATAENAEDASVDIKDSGEAIAALQEQVASLKEQALRSAADAQNTRRRAEMDVEKAHKFALEKFTKELLPVVDSLEKALEASQGDEEAVAALRQGVEMTLSMFIAGLKKFTVEQVDPVGEPFDPALHEAISMIDAPDAEPNSVVAVIQKGYTLNGRLVRPAMVMVAKASPKLDEKA